MTKNCRKYPFINCRFRLHIGLGSEDQVEKIEVTWPGGTTLTVDAPDIDNDGTGEFRDITTESGLGDVGHSCDYLFNS